MPEPTICRVVDGLSFRVGRQYPDNERNRRRNRTNELKALGNAVVPQCAEVVGWVIREIEATL
jgi:hypothetical protein